MFLRKYAVVFYNLPNYHISDKKISVCFKASIYEAVHSLINEKKKIYEQRKGCELILVFKETVRLSLIFRTSLNCYL